MTDYRTKAGGEGIEAQQAELEECFTAPNRFDGREGLTVRVLSMRPRENLLLTSFTQEQ